MCIAAALGMRARSPAPFAGVLLATDFSPAAEHALARTARLPLGRRARIVLLSVTDGGIPRARRAEVEARVRERLDEAAERLRGLVRAAGGRGVVVEAHRCTGQPYVEIIRRARRERVDLVVLGRHGARPLQRLFVGSTAERVVRLGDTPVLVVSRPSPARYARPLAAVDLSEGSRRVIDLARRLTGDQARQLLLCHAFEVPFKGLISYGTGDAERLSRAARREALAACRALCDTLGGSELACRAVVVEGDPRVVVQRVAEKRRADLVVVGTHGRSGLAHVLLGSVAEWTLRHVGCDVAVARPARLSFARP